MSEFKKVGNAKGEVTVKVSGEAWEKAKKDAFNKVKKNVEIKGFRKGQAPENMIKKAVNEKAVLAEAADLITQSEFSKAIEEHHIELIDRASVDVKQLDDNGCEFVFACPIKPDVKLGDYKTIEYKCEKELVTDAEINAELDKIKEQKADLEVKEDGTVENGDTAVIDFEGFKDGVPFEGGKGENYDLVIGSGSFIPGFEEQLIGMKSEETKEINVSFPADYHVEELKGQPVVFKVTVHEIKRKVLAELDEELIADLKIENVKTIEELTNFIKDQLQKKKDYENEQKATNEVFDKLVAMAEIDIPEVMISREQDGMVNEYAQNMAAQGISMDQFLKITGQTVEKLKENFKEEAIKRVKISLALSEVYKSEKLSVTEEDINKAYEDMAAKYQMKAEDVKKYVPEDQMKEDLELQKALEFIKTK